jgi:hypothetical protein
MSLPQQSLHPSRMSIWRPIAAETPGNLLILFYIPDEGPKNFKFR